MTNARSQDVAIRVEHLHKTFRVGSAPVLDDVSLDFPAGQLTYVLGPSGTGKSVLLRHILGLMRPDAGRVLVQGTDLGTLNDRKLAQFRRVFGVLFQNSALFDSMSVYENVAFPLREHTVLSETQIMDKVTRTLSHLGMTDGHDKLPNELSGGMRKRVGLARAIILEPQILLYDEPTTGLDPVTRTTVDELIAQLKSELKLTSVVISHDISSALNLADRIVFLSRGKVAFEGTPAEFSQATQPVIVEFLRAERRSAEALASLTQARLI